MIIHMKQPLTGECITWVECLKQLAVQASTTCGNIDWLPPMVEFILKYNWKEMLPMELQKLLLPKVVTIQKLPPEIANHFYPQHK